MFVLGNTEWSNKGDLPCFFCCQIGNFFFAESRKKPTFGAEFRP